MLVDNNDGINIYYSMIDVNKDKYTWNIEYKNYTERNKNYNIIVFSKKVYQKYLDIFDKIKIKIGSDFYFYSNILFKFNYIVPSSYIIPTIKKDINLVKDQNNIQSILSYNFKHIYSLELIFYIKKLNLYPINKNKILIFSENIHALEAIIYYQKYILQKKKIDNIYFIIHNKFNQSNEIEITLNFVKKFNVNHKVVNILTNNKLLNNIKSKRNLIILDSTILIPELIHTKTNYNLQILIAQIILALENLAEDGNLLIYTFNLTNKLSFDLLLYISNFFSDYKICNNINSSVNTIDSSFITYIFIGYKNIPGEDLEKLYKINETNYKYDKTGGYEYNKSNKTTNRKYMTLIDTTENKNQLIIYEKYKQFLKKSYLNKIKQLEEIEKLYNNRENKEYISNILKENLKYSLKYAKDNKLSIHEWVDDTKFKKIYKFKSMVDIYNMLSYKIYKLRSNCNTNISVNKKLNQDINLEQLFIKHESFYKNLEKENVKLYKKIENNIKKRQQNLHKILYEKYNININGKVVSRAWIKLYEIYNKTQFFKKFNKINAFFICEAPGNFINSTIHYLKNKTKITDFKWMAQSLKGSDIYDTYGFIKKTKNKWDFGKDETGDITKYENLLYYIEKYKNSDIVVGDCGLAWSDDENINLGYYQLFYNLLIPRKGGNFILKTHATNIDLQFFSLLYVIYCKYEKIYFFRSSVNFYSPEIYIIGKNFKGINSSEEDNLLKIFNSENILYPIDNISDKFIKKYMKYMLEFIRNYKSIKKKFFYFMKNPDIYEKLEKHIYNIIDVKNNRWIIDNIKI